MPKMAAENMVQNSVLSDAAKKLLEQAIGSVDKLTKESAGMIKAKVELPGDMATSLKVGHAKCTAYANTLAQLRDLNLMPDGVEPTKEGLDKLFMEVAVHVQSVNHKVEAAKAEIRARSK